MVLSAERYGTAQGAAFLSPVASNTISTEAAMQIAPTQPRAAGEPWAMVTDPSAAPRAKPANMNEALSESTTDASLAPTTPMSRACCAGKKD
jgi:hypothetical protein